MKKTLIALFAPAACAQAVEPVIYDALLSTTDGWAMGHDRDRALFVLNTQEQTLTLDNSNWGQSFASCTLPSTLTHDNEAPIGFSVTLNSGDHKSYTFALVGTDQAIVIGSDYDQHLLYGTSEDVSKDAYSFTANFDKGSSVLVTGTQLTTTFKENTNYVFSGKSAYDEESGTYSMNMSINGKEAFSVTGLQTLDVKKIVFTGDGANNTHNLTVSHLIVGTPEPATATLSLLALAGLAARRRRPTLLRCRLSAPHPAARGCTCGAG